MRRLRLLFRTRLLHLFVECDCLRRVLARRTVALILIGRIPVNQGFWNLLPFRSFCAVEADPVGFEFPLRGDLVRTVFEDQALGLSLSAREWRGDTKNNNQYAA